MGYRSDVAYVIGFPDSRRLNEFIAVVMAVGGEHKVNALKECDIDRENNRINFFQDSVKWYDSYEDVQGHEGLLEFAVEQNPDENGWVFIRIGEETGDIEERQDGNIDNLWDCLRVSRTIEADFDYTYEPIGDALGVEDPDKSI